MAWFFLNQIFTQLGTGGADFISQNLCSITEQPLLSRREMAK
jgi:hypothetical protein